MIKTDIKQLSNTAIKGLIGRINEDDEGKVIFTGHRAGEKIENIITARQTLIEIEFITSNSNIILSTRGLISSELNRSIVTTGIINDECIGLIHTNKTYRELDAYALAPIFHSRIIINESNDKRSISKVTLHQFNYYNAMIDLEVPTQLFDWVLDNIKLNMRCYINLVLDGFVVDNNGRKESYIVANSKEFYGDEQSHNRSVSFNFLPRVKELNFSYDEILSVLDARFGVELNLTQE